MKKVKNLAIKTRHCQVYLLDLIFLILSILVITIATLSPFNFHFDHDWKITDFWLNFNHSSFFQDQLNNVLLFMPLGFCFAGLLQKQAIHLGLQVIIIFLFSAGLSFTVETLQIFLPSRSPTPEDIVNNTLGGCLGLLCFYIWNYQFLNVRVSQFTSSRSQLSNQRITVFILAYFALTLVISIFWQSTTNLSNWNVNFPLLIGNEAVGNRPWQGYIKNLYITERAMSPYEAQQALSNTNYFTNLGNNLIANYQFSSSCCYLDNTGNSSELIWVGQPKIINSSQGVLLNSRQWLTTRLPVKTLSQRLSHKSEFTMITTLATDKLQQTGPARIISISGNVLERNLTISQYQKSLELRLRTPLTGENGADLQIQIPGIFQDTNFHQLIITYSRGTIQVYMDKIQRFYSLNLLELIPFHQKVFYYALTFIPLGAGLAILNLFAQNRATFSRVFIPIALFLPSLVLEIILVNVNHKNLSWKNLCLGIIFTSITMLIFKIRGKYIQV
ncbi:MAG: VanZ family protein [Nostocales cyanobacterium]|nr:MAG: VanZ family protein [Nostocales cyanobacterium]TAF14184.1 MAG: VanZ family protein [Nostocales cyanobacterium]